MDSGHQNYLLYDTKTHFLMRFETFGDVDTECLSNEKIDTSIDELFRKNVPNFKKYIKPFSGYLGYLFLFLFLLFFF